MKQISVIIIGAGDRGTTYARKMQARPDKYRVVGVAEPIEGRRRVIQKMFDIPEDMCFPSWENILSIPKAADLAVIATKVTNPKGPFPNQSGQGRKHILQDIEESLRSLRTDYIDIYYLHHPDPDTPMRSPYTPSCRMRRRPSFSSSSTARK